MSPETHTLLITTAQHLLLIAAALITWYLSARTRK